MKILDRMDLFTELCRYERKWGILVNLPWTEDYPDLTADEFLSNLPKAVPWFDFDTGFQCIADGFAVVLGTEREIEDLYQQVVGDDGPTYLNSYDGPVRVYALTCNPEGQTENENT
jgi:hypothetical protein